MDTSDLGHGMATERVDMEAAHNVSNVIIINIMIYFNEPFGIADLTRIAQKKFGHSWTSLIKVEGLFSSYIVTHFDIVNSESLV